jgi:hypothetical protein
MTPHNLPLNCAGKKRERAEFAGEMGEILYMGEGIELLGT